MNPDRAVVPFYTSMALMLTLFLWIFLPILGVKVRSVSGVLVMAMFTLVFWLFAFGWSLFCDYNDEKQRRKKMFLSEYNIYQGDESSVDSRIDGNTDK